VISTAVDRLGRMVRVAFGNCLPEAFTASVLASRVLARVHGARLLMIIRNDSGAALLTGGTCLVSGTRLLMIVGILHATRAARNVAA
jgi:hypothetical protein